MSAKIIITIAAITLLGTLFLVHQASNKQTTLPNFDHTFYTSQLELLSYGNKEVNYEMLFLHYKKIHNLKFGAAEDSTRFTVFKSNCDKIVAHNAKNSSYELGLTDLAHLTREEFAATRLGYAGAQKKTNNNAVVLNADNIAETVDWTTKKAVTDVKNQGQCGSCWAFSTTGALEGLNAIQNGKLVSLSEQELVDCSTSYGNNGCNGGLMDYGFQYAAENGLSTEADYSYTAADGNCQSKGKKKAYKNKAFQDVPVNDPDQLAAAITKGPVSVAIEADTSDFQLYKTGILTGDGCGTQLDHGVLAVGYGKDHFKVKNSWGASWGQNGYVLIGRANGEGVCGINEAASYPTQ